jgi:XRCC1 N terminal domain
MRKSIVSPSNTVSSSPSQMLDLEQIASVEISSEDAQHPFENALSGGKPGGWRAADPGPQVIRLRFDKPQAIRRIHLAFREDRVQRSQEFALFATSAAHLRREVVRQQWSFSPGGSATEVEDYSVELPDVSILELEIDPGRHDKQAIASLESIAIA